MRVGICPPQRFRLLTRGARVAEGMTEALWECPPSACSIVVCLSFDGETIVERAFRAITST